MFKTTVIVEPFVCCYCFQVSYDVEVHIQGQSPDVLEITPGISIHNLSLLTLYDPGGGGGAFKAPPPPIFCSHAFNFGATLLCVGDFSQKIV